jgi:hypothetical protein
LESRPALFVCGGPAVTVQPGLKRHPGRPARPPNQVLRLQPHSAPGVSLDREGAVFLAQIVDVTFGVSYKMAGRLKTQNLDGGFAFMQIAFLDKYGALVEDASTAPKSALINRDQDYREEVFEAAAPPSAAMAELRICINGKGTCYVKNVMFVQA